MSERNFEMAARLADAERDTGVSRASWAVTGRGCADCITCGEEIEAARRAAAPFAQRCIGCQQAFERGVR